MLRRVSFSNAGVFIVALLVLSACGGGAATQPPATEPPATEVPSFTFSLPVAQIESITYSPAKFKEGDKLTFTINYENSSSDVDLNETILKIDYDPSLIYENSTPVRDSESDHHLSWNLGTLNHQAKSSVTVNFIVTQLPSPLSLDTNISGKISQETSSDNRLILIYPDQGAEKVYPKAEVYPEGVSVYLQEQGSGEELHSERRTYDVSMGILPGQRKFIA